VFWPYVGNDSTINTRSINIAILLLLVFDLASGLSTLN